MIHVLAGRVESIKSVVVGEIAMMSYEEYELECRKQIERNEKFLEMFERDLVSVGLPQTTIRKHLSNVDFYINTYLLREEPLGMERGCFKIDTFFGYFLYTNACGLHREILKQLLQV